MVGIEISRAMPNSMRSAHAARNMNILLFYVREKMVHTCCINNCKSQWKITENVTFHNPPSDVEWLKKFIAAIPPNSRPKVSKYSRICSKHFTADCFHPTTSTSARRILKKNAIPTLFDYDVNCRMVEEPSNIMGRKDVEVQTMEYSTIQKKDVGVQVHDNSLRPSEAILELRSKVKSLQRRLLQRDTRLNKMSDIVEHLRQNNISTQAIEDVLHDRFHEFSCNLFNNELQNSFVPQNNKRYNEEMKSFALTLYFYSPKAYKFVRSKLNLPHDSTLRKWLSTYNCQPGFSSEIIEFLKKEVTKNQYLKDVALIFDSMSIRSEIVYDKKMDKYRGYVDLGGIATTDLEQLATESLVLQIVSYSRKFKIPIAYFFINKPVAELQCQILNEAMTILQEIGITVRSITCDGCATNIKTLTLLGCKLFSENMVTSFKHPATNSKVYCILDACHMLKLCRNALAEENIVSPKGRISFQYIRKLHELQEVEDLKLANRITSAHINFKNKKMNVRLATQVISSGVADAIDYLRLAGDTRFAGSEATTEFLRIFDRLFDIMNSRSVYAKGFKSPIFLNSIPSVQQFFSDAVKYIMTLQIKETNILWHKRKTFSIGFICNTLSILDLASVLLTKETPLKYFLTYKCSQDHLELFFSCIRSQGGWNDNPNSMQFMWALRKMLFRNAVTPSINANCISDTTESQSILEFRSAKRTILENVNINDDIPNEEDEAMKKLVTLMDRIELSSLQENILYYVSGLIVKKLLMEISCTHCQRFLIQLNSDSDHTYTINPKNYMSFTSFVNRGKVCFPSKHVLGIIKSVEKAFRTQIQIKDNLKLKQKISSAVMEKFAGVMFDLFTPPHPVMESDGIEELHEFQILKLIINRYSNVRITTYAKKATERYLGERITLRQKMHKNILFLNV